MKDDLTVKDAIIAGTLIKLIENNNKKTLNYVDEKISSLPSKEIVDVFVESNCLYVEFSDGDTINAGHILTERGPGGPPGLQGRNGTDGRNGKDGLDGINGEKGDKGDPGADGKDGLDGQPGLNGKDGRDGIDGKDGVDGIDGKDGLDGKPGRDGKDGLDGKDGFRGLQGPKGLDGKPGLDGKDGRDGRDGIDGKDGPRGPKGDPGKDGSPGVKGDKGDPGKDADEVSLKEELTKYINAELVKFNKLLGRMSKSWAGTSSGGGSAKILDNDDVVFHRPSQVANNSVLVFDSTLGKFKPLDIATLINSVITEVEMQYTKLVDVAGDYNYIGEATPGTATNATTWRIRRVYTDPVTSDIEILWADGTSDFAKTWDNRASYTYS